MARLGRALCLAGAGLGALGIAAWLLGIQRVLTPFPGLPPMMPNSAFGILLLGIAGPVALEARARRMPRLFATLGAMLVLAVSVGTITEYALNTHLFVDDMVGDRGRWYYPGVSSPPTAIALALLAAGVLLFDKSFGRRVSEWLVLAALLIAMTALLGYLYGAASHYSLTGTPDPGIERVSVRLIRATHDVLIIGTPLFSAVSLFLISTGLVLGRPDWRTTSILAGNGPGSLLARRLGPVAILVPIGFGIVASRLPGIGSSPVVLAFLTDGTSALTLSLLGITAVGLNRGHDTLEAERSRTRELIELASDAIIIFDLDGQVIDANQAACRLQGYSREEMFAKRVWDFVPPEDLERLKQERRILLQGNAETSEWTVVRKDRSRILVEVSAKILPGGRWQAIVRDISERKRVENALRESEERLRRISDNAGVGLVRCNRDWRYLSANPAYAKIAGKPLDEILGRTIVEVIGAEGADMIRPYVDRVLGGEALTYESDVPYSGAGTRFLQVSYTPDADAAGRIIGWIASITDISVQKQAEREHRILAEVATTLAESTVFDERLTSIAQVFSRELADLCIVDIADNGNMRRGAVACRDSVQQPVCDALMRPPADGEVIRASAQTRTGELFFIQKLTPDVIDFFAPSAAERAALKNAKSVIAAPLLARGKMIGVVSLLSFSREFGEQDLRLVQPMSRVAALMLDNARLLADTQTAKQARDEMLGVVAHDLRNPLTAITILARVLLRGPQHEIGEEIGLASGRMNRLIQDLIDVTRLETGSLSLKRAVLSCHEILSDVVASQEPLASAASLELHLDAAQDLPEIWADRDRLLQVFENLIGNAMKFTKPGGRITLSARGTSNEVLFSVADTGPGIESKHLPHVFDRFWQGPGEKRSGLGLGLPIVKGMVEAHGGRVWVQSSLGRGSTFFFSIPTAAKANTATAPKAALPSKTASAA